MATWKAIIFDGSGFDSGQNSDVMDAVDKEFWAIAEKSLHDLLVKFK